MTAEGAGSVPSRIKELAGLLDEATLCAIAIPQLSHREPLTLDEAYAVQHAGITLRAGRGETVVGVKLGFTSKAKAAQMGVSDVIVGQLTDAMRIEAGGSVDVSAMIHPRIEPEVAFRLGTGFCADDPGADLATAVTHVAPAMEIIDSRYRDFTFSLEDVVADNTSAAGFVLGPWRSLPDVRATSDFTNAAVVLEVDGHVVQTGSTAAILGDPMRALSAVERMADRRGLQLPAGTIILAGAATAAVPFTAGSVVETAVTGLGRVVVTAGQALGHG